MTTFYALLIVVVLYSVINRLSVRLVILMGVHKPYRTLILCASHS